MIFYRSPYLRITHRVFEVYHPCHRAFRLDELWDVHVVERDGGHATMIYTVRIGSTGVAGAAAVAVALHWPALDPPTTSLPALALLAISATVSGACWRVRRRRYELCARYRGRPVRLFQSTDIRSFSQVKRALVRAMEYRADQR